MPRAKAQKATTDKTTETKNTRATKAAKTAVAMVEAQSSQAETTPRQKPTADRKKLYDECRKKLLKAKEDHLSHFDQKRQAISEHISGDDGDLANASEEQDVAVIRRESLLQLLSEIEYALERLGDGTYGVCEETGDLIESERLAAIPWTRLSLEGAITREKEQPEMSRRRVG